MKINIIAQGPMFSVHNLRIKSVFLFDGSINFVTAVEKSYAGSVKMIQFTRVYESGHVENCIRTPTDFINLELYQHVEVDSINVTPVG